MENTSLISEVMPNMSNPAMRAFQNAGITTIDDLMKWKSKDLLKLHGVGPKAIRIIREKLGDKFLE